MTEKDLALFKTSLLRHRAALLEWLDSDPAPDDVHLGGSPVADVLQMMSELKHAIERVDTGTFGSCSQCDGEVERGRLELDCTAQVCLAHYSDAQIEALESDTKFITGVVPREFMEDYLELKLRQHKKSLEAISGSELVKYYNV